MAGPSHALPALSPQAVFQNAAVHYEIKNEEINVPILANLKKAGYRGGRICIAHCCNESGAQELKDRVLAVYPGAAVTVHPTRWLCSLYAEKSGLLVGYDLDRILFL